MRRAAARVTETGMMRREEAPGACYLCGGQRLKQVLALHLGRRYVLYRCRRCRLEFVSPLPGSDFYDLAYYRSNYLQYEADRGAQFSHFLDNLAAAGCAPPILDVGCGTGLFVALARRRGYPAWGVEPSAAARQIAEERYGVRLHSSLAELDEKEKYRTAVLWQVLAHTFDPAAELQRVASRVEPGGHIIFSFCNWGDPRYRAAKIVARLRHRNTIHMPALLWRFREHHVAAVAQRAGLGIERFTYEPRPVRGRLSWKGRMLESAFSVERALTGRHEEMHAWCRRP